MTDLAELLAAANEAVDLARELIRNRPAGSLTDKGDRDMASEVDFAVEETVRSFLAKRTPAVAMLGEEEGSSGTQGGLTWALDPVDGTANFVHGIPLCGVSLGLIEDDQQMLGVIDLPFLGTRVTAAKGLGAYADGKQLTARATPDLKSAIVAIGDYAVGDDSDAKNHRRISLTADLAGHVQRVRMLGSAAIDLAWVASGKLDASITLSNKPWDTAAGVAIAREAGAIVMDADGSPHTCDSAATIAAAPAIAEQIIELVSRHAA